MSLIQRQMPGVPVKWVEDRVEHLLASTHARDHRYRLKTGFSSDGESIALDGHLSYMIRSAV